MTYSSLKQSDAGFALKALKKHGDSGVRKMAKSVIADWRAAYKVVSPASVGVCRELCSEILSPHV